MSVTEAAILERIIEPREGELSPEAARFLLSLDFRAGDRRRVDELTSKAQAGTLTVEEQADLEHYRRVARFLDRMRSKAQQMLSRQASVPSSPEPPDSLPIPPGILRSQEAFWRDLPDLLRNRKNLGKWVGYHKEERIGIARDKTTLIREILRRGVPRDEYYLDKIEADCQPPWEPVEVERLHSHEFEGLLPEP